MSTTMKLGSPQAMTIYYLLSEHSNLTAKEIGDKLDILPNAVYRAIRQLIDLGVVKASESYPVRYSTVPISSAMGWFLLNAQRSFKESFSKANEQQHITGPTITFIKSRASLLNKTNKDAESAKQEINFIVSGLEVPDETVFAYRKAITKGVKIRALLQKRNETSPGKLEKWQDIGVRVRYTNDLGMRLFVIDKKIVYFTSYSQQSKEQAFGVRFDYPPIASLMNSLFEEQWQKATATVN